MNGDLNQWLTSSKPKNINDDLAPFRSLSLSSSSELPSKFRLPALLTSDNTSTWLMTRKNANENVPASAQKNDDNSKWLLRSKIVDDNHWLNKSVMTTSATSLPGNSSMISSTYSSVLAKKDDLDRWLIKSNAGGVKKDAANDFDEWLLVSSLDDVQAEKYTGFAKNPFEKWQKLTSTYAWISAAAAEGKNNQRQKVQEWLIKALDDNIDDEQTDDDFDDCSIEIIS